MFLSSSFPPQRRGMNRIEFIVAANLLVMSVLLLLPACQRRIDNGARTQSTNNLKQIGLAMQSFHDFNKRIPFNGIAPGSKASPKDSNDVYHGNALSSDARSGSWLFQILPYCEQATMFSLSGKANSDEIPAAMLTTGVQMFMCPLRGRQAYEDGRGPWSDYFISNYLNDPAKADLPDNMDMRVTLLGITDGTSNTIFSGHGNIATGDYAKTKNVAGSSTIFNGGTEGTMRGGSNWVPGKRPRSTLQRDSAAPPLPPTGSWGGPSPTGALFIWCDGTVRQVAYSTAPDLFGAYLTPTGKEEVALPE